MLIYQSDLCSAMLDELEANQGALATDTPPLGVGPKGGGGGGHPAEWILPAPLWLKMEVPPKRTPVLPRSLQLDHGLGVAVLAIRPVLRQLPKIPSACHKRELSLDTSGGNSCDQRVRCTNSLRRLSRSPFRYQICVCFKPS